MKEKFVMKLFSLCVTTTNEESPLWTPVSPYFGCITNQRGAERSEPASSTYPAEFWVTLSPVGMEALVSWQALCKPYSIVGS